MKANTYLGKFIAFEGLDGSGKSIQAQLLKDLLTSEGYEVSLTKEPTESSTVAGQIRKIVDGRESATPAELQILCANDRREHLYTTIIPTLKEGRFVITDRYFFSSLAYGATELDINWLCQLNEEFLVPDITFILEVRPEVCMKRIRSRGLKTTLFEDTTKLTKVWQVYNNLPQLFDNVHIISGEKSIDNVFEDIKNILSIELCL